MAGEVLGAAGGNPGGYALDFGMFDLRVRQDDNVANPERYQSARFLSSVCFLLYYKESPVLDRLIDLVSRDKVEGETIPCGSYLQDIPGTAQGNWFLLGVNETNPEDPHMALAPSNLRPAQAVISMGTSVPGLRAGAHGFLPVDQGLLNRDFKDITPDGLTYGFEIIPRGSVGFAGIVIVGMPDEETLWIETLTGATSDPSSWAFTENKTTFKR